MSVPTFGVVVFPGSNCDHDAYYAVKKILGFNAEFLWHKEPDLKNCDAIILPGGFSYGDYLRAGAIAKISPIMQKVYDFAESGGIVIGICNGFQVLTELGLLPGALMKNESLQFACKDVFLRVEQNDSAFTSQYNKGEVISVPIAHGEGNFFVDDETLRLLESENRILFRYCDGNGTVNAAVNPNGSLNNIAGIINKRGNVLGMMPHPERCCDTVLQKTDGTRVFTSIAASVI